MASQDGWEAVFAQAGGDSDIQQLGDGLAPPVESVESCDALQGSADEAEDEGDSPTETNYSGQGFFPFREFADFTDAPAFSSDDDVRVRKMWLPFIWEFCKPQLDQKGAQLRAFTILSLFSGLMGESEFCHVSYQVRNAEFSGGTFTPTVRAQRQIQ